VREALARAVDVPALVREVTAGQGIPIASSIVPGSWADVLPPPTSTVELERARMLLDEAGWIVPEGQEIRANDALTLTAQLYVRGDDPRRVRAAELIAQAARAIGMDIVVQRADFETVIRSKYAPPYDFDLLLGSWTNGAGDLAFADYAFYDPDDFNLFHRSQINQGVADTRAVLNIGGFADSAYDNQAAAARQLYDPQERLNAIRLAQQRIAAARPYLFLWDDRFPVALSAQVTTLDGPVDLNTPMYLWNVERWYLKK
jgi:peptide/nickel transport system substrate-binding protein